MPNPLKRNNLLSIALFALMLIPLSNVMAQDSIATIKADLELIDRKKCQHLHHKHKKPFIYAKQPVRFKTHNPLSLLYGGLLFIYQNTVSQHFSADCLYSPSCSEFSKLAVKEYGFVKGGLLSFDRLNRCTRLSAVDLKPSTIDPHTHRSSDPISKYK
ncbi:MAG: membrane protein insertion efficiency factor YidD [Prolixibacteraceae bacterium]|nr:membrane protein insertion efficiency factor YidD [Prolixibacteraceae bacterium]